jgi:hypothetical protein
LRFYARLVNPGAAPDLTAALKALPHVAGVNIFFDEEAD